MQTFKAKIQIIGVNPYVLLPAMLRNDLFRKAGKDKGPIPVKGKINGKPFIQTLVKYSGRWRLYLNTPMRKQGKCEVGDIANFSIAYDPKQRITQMPALLKLALEKNKSAKSVFEKLPVHYQKEVMRYINNLKSEEAVIRNVDRTIQHLVGNARFVGRNPPNKKQ